MHFVRAFAFFSSPESQTGHSRALVWLALACSLCPLGTLLAFGWVFLQGGSYYAQYSESHELWSVWFNAWDWLVPASVLFGLAALVAFVRDRDRQTRPLSFSSRLYLLLAYPVCYFVLATTVPDA